MLKINVFWEMKRERVFLQNVEKTLLIHTNLRQYTIHLTVPQILMPVISMTEFLDYNDLILYVFCDILFSISRLFYIFNYYLFFIIYTLLHYL